MSEIPQKLRTAQPRYITVPPLSQLLNMRGRNSITKKFTATTVEGDIVSNESDEGDFHHFSNKRLAEHSAIASSPMSSITSDSHSPIYKNENAVSLKDLGPLNFNPSKIWETGKENKSSVNNMNLSNKNRETTGIKPYLSKKVLKNKSIIILQPLDALTECSLTCCPSPELSNMMHKQSKERKSHDKFYRKVSNQNGVAKNRLTKLTQNSAKTLSNRKSAGKASARIISESVTQGDKQLMAAITAQVYRLIKDRVAVDFTKLWVAFQSKAVTEWLKRCVNEERILVVDQQGNQ